MEQIREGWDMAEDPMDKVISAFEDAVGINKPDIKQGTTIMTFIPKEKDFTALRELYGDPATKHIIDKFLEIGNIDKSVVGL